MYKIGKNKKLAKLVTASFALNALGGITLPMAAGATTVAPTPEDEAAAKEAQEKQAKEAAVQSAKDYQAQVAAATSSIIELKDTDDDLQFLNKVISLCTDSNKETTVAENYKRLMDGAKAAAEAAEDAGREPDAMTKKLISADERVRRIAKDLKNAGTIDVDAVPANVTQSAIAAYQKAVAAKKVCEAEAEKDGKDKSKCVLGEEGAAAANFLMTKGLRQVNVTSTDPTPTNAVETKGASKESNKDSHWVRGEDGLYHEVTNETAVDGKCGDGEILVDGKCAKAEAACKEGEALIEGKCVTVKTTCEDGEALVDGKCVPNPKSCVMSSDGKVVIDGSCTIPENVCGEGETLVEKDGYGVCKKPDEKLSCGVFDGPPGAEYIVADGECQEVVKVCKSDEVKVDGVCQKKQDECTDGKVLKDGKCVAPDVPVCKSTEELKDGKCVTKGTTCGKGEEAVGGKCVKACEEDEERGKDGKCVTKCKEGEERGEDGVCVPKCSENEELKDGKCVAKAKCPTDGYVESNGQCCPTQYPTYDAGTGRCISNEEEQAAGGKSGSKNNMGTILGMLGAIGAITGVFGGGEPGGEGDGVGQTRQNVEGNLQYAFNYMFGKDKKDVHLFPANTNTPIKFKLFNYGLPKARDGQKAQPKAEAHVMMLMHGADGTWNPKVVEIPLQIGEMTPLFPKTTEDGGAVYLPLKELGTIERVPASTFGLPYYTMTVVADDGISGHLREFNIHYDFVTEESRIVRNPDENMEKGTYDIVGTEPTIGFSGLVSGAEWDAATQTCRISVSDGTFTDNAANERYDTKEGEAFDFVSERYEQSGCEKIAGAKGSKIGINGLKVADNKKGGLVLSDSDPRVTAGIYGIGDENGNELFDPIQDIKKAFQTGFGIEQGCSPTSVSVQGQTWPGYDVCVKSDGIYLRDSNGNTVDEKLGKNQTEYICQQSGDEVACNAVKIDVCSSSQDFGKICAYGKDGKETPISGEGFTRKTTGGNMSRQEVEDAYKKNTAKNGESWWSNPVEKLGTIIKDLFGQNNRPVTVDEAAGQKSAEEEKNDLQGSNEMTKQTEAILAKNNAAKGVAKAASQVGAGNLAGVDTNGNNN